MAIQTGLNSRLYVEGNDLSGDANGFDISQTRQSYEVTTLDSGAFKRLEDGLVDATVGVSAFFDAASSRISAVATANSGTLPSVDQDVLIPFGADVGSACAGFTAKQSDYITTGAVGSPMTVSVNYTINAVSPMMGKMLTAHDDTITSSTSGTAVDDSSSSSDGGSWCYQILAFSAVGGNARWIANVQHSSDDDTYTDVITEIITAVGAGSGTFTGTLNRYVKNRVVLDASSGSITFAISYVRA